MIDQKIKLQDEAFSLYCRLSTVLEDDIFSASAARMGQVVSIADQTLSQYQKRLAAACRRAYFRFERRSDVLFD